MTTSPPPPPPGHRRLIIAVDVHEPLDPSKPQATAEGIIALADSHHPKDRQTMSVVSAHWEGPVSA